jgi:hypothetical protein
VSPSQESAQPQPVSPPPADPTGAGPFGGSAFGPETDGYRPARHGPGESANGSGPGESVGGFGPGEPANGSGPGESVGGFGLAHPSGPLPEAADESRASRWWGYRRSARRPWRRTVTVAVSVALTAVVLGGPLGLLWAWLAPDVPVIDAGQNGIVVNDPSPEEYIAADGWFTLLGLGFGLLVAIVAWQALRRDRGPFLLLGVIVGTLGGGWLVAPRVGEMIGRNAYEHWRETAVQGATYLAPPEIHSVGPTLVPAFAAAIVLTLLAGWSNDPDLEHPGALPGYGPNTAADAYGEEESHAGGPAGTGAYAGSAEPGPGEAEAYSRPGDQPPQG